VGLLASGVESHLALFPSRRAGTRSLGMALESAFSTSSLHRRLMACAAVKKKESRSSQPENNQKKRTPRGTGQAGHGPCTCIESIRTGYLGVSGTGVFFVSPSSWSLGRLTWRPHPAAFHFGTWPSSTAARESKRDKKRLLAPFLFCLSVIIIQSSDFTLKSSYAH
jgi:hypothetical protein